MDLEEALKIDNEETYKEEAVLRPYKPSWSWGAFGLTWIYGIFNHSLPCLIGLVPLIGLAFGKDVPLFVWLVCSIISGLVGEDFSYKHIQNRKYTQKDLVKWKKKIHRWDVAGIVVSVAALALASFSFGCVYMYRAIFGNLLFQQTIHGFLFS